MFDRDAALAQDLGLRLVSLLRGIVDLRGGLLCAGVLLFRHGLELQLSAGDFGYFGLTERAQVRHLAVVDLFERDQGRHVLGVREVYVFVDSGLGGPVRRDFIDSLDLLEQRMRRSPYKSCMLVSQCGSAACRCRQLLKIGS